MPQSSQDRAIADPVPRTPTRDRHQLMNEEHQEFLSSYPTRLVWLLYSIIRGFVSPTGKRLIPRSGMATGIHAGSAKLSLVSMIIRWPAFYELPRLSPIPAAWSTGSFWPNLVLA